jgi:hypothetical protein
MHSEAEFWTMDDLETDAERAAQDKAFGDLLRQRMKRGKRDDSRDNEKLRRNKRRVSK